MKENNENSMNSIERVSTILSLKEPDYVPIWLLIDFLPAKYYDISVEELIFDPIKSQKAYEWIYEKLGGYDITLPGSAMYAVHINPFPIIYSSYYLDWRLPGRDLPKNTSPQLSEKSSKDPLINEKDYEKLIEKGFLQVFNFKRAGLRDLMKLNKMVELIKKNSEKWWNYFKVPTLADAAAYLPFEFLSYLRGSTNFMKDLYRYPEKIKEVCDFMIDGVIAIGEYAASLIDGRTILTALIRSSCDFISDKYFEEFVFPYLKKAVSKWLSDGYIVQLHCDTDWTSRLHYFKELPKGKVYLHIDERTDIFKAKEILGDHMCIQGNLKPSLFTLGTPNQIIKQTKEIIDKCADGGGLWIGSEIPDDAKLENVKALIDTCKTYGKYKK